MSRLLWCLRIVLAIVLLSGAHGVRAQQAGVDRVWLQIEAQPTLLRAEERARAYATLFPDIEGFRLTSGWYALVLGPYGVEAGARRLSDLGRENLVPADSFVSDGSNFLESFWPVGPALLEPPPDLALDPFVSPDLSLALPEDGLPSETVTPIAPLDPVETAPLAPPPETPPVAAAGPPDETPGEARRSEAALTRTDREALQSALQWFGHYEGAIDGQFGPGTRAAMAGWQAANAAEPTGILTSRARQTLLDAFEADRATLGLQSVTETAAGIEITLPLALVAFDRYAPPFVQYTARDESGVSVLLISQPGDAGTLAGLYDVLQTLEIMPMNGERSKGEESFRLTGRNAEVESHAFAQLDRGLIKGFVLSWRPKDEARMERVLSTMQATFRPVGAMALDPGLVPLGAASRSDLAGGLEIRRPLRVQSGLFVDGAGSVLTTADAVAGCGRVTIDRDLPVSVRQTEADGLALLVPQGSLAPGGVAAFSASAAAPGSEVAVSGHAYGDALPAPVLTFGVFETDKGLNGEADLLRLTMAVLPGDVGGPLVDASGAVLGLLLPRAANSARVLPPEVVFAASAARIAGFLTANGIMPATSTSTAALPPDDLAARTAAMTVRVACWE